MLTTAITLSGLGLVMLYALSTELFYHQGWAMIVGLIAYLFTRRADNKMLKHLWWVWYGGAILLLTVSLISPEVRGSHRWIELFGVSIQPSEIMKPLIILSMAGFITTGKSYGIKRFVIYTGLLLVPLFLVLKQPDLGNGVVYLCIYLSLLFVSYFPLKYYLTPLILLILIIPLSWPLLEDYQKLRIVTFLNPSYDLQGAGYNAYQAFIAVGSGGLMGKGLGAGTQSRLAFLPEFHTDFIFAATVEQVGLLGGIAIVVLYALLLISILQRLRERNIFNRLVVWGTFSQLLIQIIINIGMNTGIVPITGITLPLLSYGGSSVVATYISLGILASFRESKKDIIAIR